MTGLSWRQFRDLPEEYTHADLVDGALFVGVPTRPRQRVVSRLVTALTVWTGVGEGRGEVTLEAAVQIAADRGYMPDIAWWCEDKCSAPDQPATFQGPPDLVVEVLSPSTRRLDIVRKREDYPRIGVAELWLIDPDEPSAHVVRTHADSQVTLDVSADYELRSPLLDGFAIRLGDLTHR